MDVYWYFSIKIGKYTAYLSQLKRIHALGEGNKNRLDTIEFFVEADLLKLAEDCNHMYCFLRRMSALLGTET